MFEQMRKMYEESILALGEIVRVLDNIAVNGWKWIRSHDISEYDFLLIVYFIVLLLVMTV